jgi:alpha-tubulin suppressor-like RCC1 family protein
VDREVVIASISCGMYHMGGLSENHEGWTWGKDDNGCLGRPGSMRDIGGTVD